MKVSNVCQTVIVWVYYESHAALLWLLPTFAMYVFVLLRRCRVLVFGSSCQVGDYTLGDNNNVDVEDNDKCSVC